MKKLFLILLCSLISFNAYSLSIISDEETESWLEDVLTPIFKEANLPLSRDKIHIVKDNSLNAFVGSSNHLFVHTGTLIGASSANEIEGVLAHETGHILGGHLLRLKIKLQDIEKASLASLVAAAGAAAISGRGDAAIAVVLGTQSSAINSMTNYQITEERAADETAVSILSKQQKSLKGLKDFMEKIKSANRLEGVKENPYFRTHPLTQERITFFNEKIKTEPQSTPDEELNQRLRRIQAKLYAYIYPLNKVLRKYPLSDTSTEGKIAHTIYFMRQKNINAVSKYIDPLITEEPLNPYFWELKAQALYESHNLKDAAIAYKQALDLKPSSDLFKISYAEAKLALSPTPKEQQKLIPLLEHANRNKNTPEAYHLLGQIYSNLKQHAIADYYAAEYNHATGNDKNALRMVKKALSQNLRQDILLRAKDLKTKLSKDTEPKKTLL